MQIVVTKYAYYTKVGKSPTNPYKVNQDNFVVQPKLGAVQNQHFFAVADGHGKYIYCLILIVYYRTVWKRGFNHSQA